MENKKENIEIIETSEVVTEENSFASLFGKSKGKKIRNQALFKRGGYSLAITAFVLAGLIVFNWLVSSLADRFNLEFDMTTNQKNSISEDNIKYLESLDADVTVTICSSEDQYVDYMTQLSQEYFGVYISSYSDVEYFIQTQTLLSKYPDYNDRITIKYVDPQSTEFTAISTNHPDYDLFFGDIIVTSTVDGNERSKLLTFEDIYATTSGSSSYYLTLSGNSLETALTSAIAYVTSDDIKKAGVITGHSNNSYTDAYIELLELNNYEVTLLDEKLITSISSDYDILVISAPTIDFIGSELDLISDFLDNDNKLGKGLVYFADAACPSLPNLNAFLKDWGIEISEGILFGAGENSSLASSPSSLLIYPVSLEGDDITESILKSGAVANYNVPMKVCETSTYEREATAFMKTTDQVVIAPVGSAADWSDYTDEDKAQFDCVIQSVETDYDKENNNATLTSYVMAFSSVEFVQSTWASESSLCNKDIVMACTERAAHNNTSFVFTPKLIQNETFASKVTEEDSKTVDTIFMFVLPVIVIACGIVVFIRRRNAR